MSARKDSPSCHCDKGRFALLSMVRAHLVSMICVQYFSQNGVEFTIIPLPTWEANKTFDLVFEIARQLEDFRVNR
jgi:hypothetical protein